LKKRLAFLFEISYTNYCR